MDTSKTPIELCEEYRKEILDIILKEILCGRLYSYHQNDNYFHIAAGVNLCWDIDEYANKWLYIDSVKFKTALHHKIVDTIVDRLIQAEKEIKVQRDLAYLKDKLAKIKGDLK
jgi:hypothetical protein